MWFKRGKVKVEIGSLSIAALCLAAIIPDVNYVLFQILLSSDTLPVVVLFFWYHLLCAFSREPSAKVSLYDEKGRKTVLPPFDVDIR